MHLKLAKLSMQKNKYLVIIQVVIELDKKSMCTVFLAKMSHRSKWTVGYTVDGLFSAYLGHLDGPNDTGPSTFNPNRQKMDENN